MNFNSIFEELNKLYEGITPENRTIKSDLVKHLPAKYAKQVSKFDVVTEPGKAVKVDAKAGKIIVGEAAADDLHELAKRVQIDLMNITVGTSETVEEACDKKLKEAVDEDVKEKVAVFIDLSGSNSSPSVISKNEKLAKNELVKFRDDGAFVKEILYFASRISADPQSNLGTGSNFAAISTYLDEKNISRAIIITDEDIDANADGIELQKDSRVKVVKTDIKDVKEDCAEEGCNKKLTEANEEEFDDSKLAMSDKDVAIVNEPFEGEEPAEEVEEAEARQLILECSKCGALVIKDEADVVFDEESDFVNVEDECEYCEEKEGYKIIGVVAPYEAAEVVEDSAEEVDEEPVEEVEESKTEDLTEAKVTKQRLTVVEPGYQYKDADGSIYTLYGDECEEDDTGITYSWDYVDDDVDGDIYIF